MNSSFLLCDWICIKNKKLSHTLTFPSYYQQKNHKCCIYITPQFIHFFLHYTGSHVLMESWDQKSKDLGGTNKWKYGPETSRSYVNEIYKQ